MEDLDIDLPNARLAYKIIRLPTKARDALRVSFVVFLLLTSSAFPQQEPPKPEAKLVGSFGKVTNGHIRSQLDSFLADIANYGIRGLIVNYGSYRELAARKNLIDNHIKFRKFDSARVEFSIGGSISQFRTDLWIIPDAAEPPRLDPEAYITAEFGRVKRIAVVRIIKGFFVELGKNPDHQGYIINYGSGAQIRTRERWITDNINFRRFDRSRITLVRGGRKGGLKTVMWIVPPGAELPVP